LLNVRKRLIIPILHQHAQGRKGCDVDGKRQSHRSSPEIKFLFGSGIERSAVPGRISLSGSTPEPVGCG
jgi:hypothetical protein